ncbi:MAG: ATPase [Phycisphaerae bacterium]
MTYGDRMSREQTAHGRTMFPNPFRPGAGHMPPYLAGRTKERDEFKRLLDQEVVMANPILTGLRGVGKTVLLETFKPLAQSAGWLWVGTDLSESASINESNLITRLITDVSVISSELTVLIESEKSGPRERRLDNGFLMERCNETPGLMSDKLRCVLELVHDALPADCKGVVFAYDEAQNLSDHAEEKEYPLSVLLEVFQSVQKKGIPFMLLLTGLPTLFPKLVDARTYAERMFRVMFLERLNETESKDAIKKPISSARCPVTFADGLINSIWKYSGGYPYFIQFICREAFDVILQQRQLGQKLAVPMKQVIRKLDSDFFAGRWANATDRQRVLLQIIAGLPSDGEEFSVKEVVAASKTQPKPFSSSHVNQMLASLAAVGLVYKNRYGKYSFAVPLLADFIRRQADA